MTSLRSQSVQAVLCRFAIAGALMLGNYAQAQNSVNPIRALKPIYWQEKLFYIPYQAKEDDKLLQRVEKVQLLLSRDGSSDWRVLQEARPNVKGFSYLAPEDGDYWFALRHIDRQGRASDSGAPQPQLRIIVDTELPQLRLNATLGLTGEVVVRYESLDVNLDVESHILEVRSGQGSWTQLSPTAHDVAQPDKLVGRANWQPPKSADMVEVRAAITDQAGHRAEAKTEVVVSGPALSKSFARQNAAGVSTQIASTKNPFSQTTQTPTQDWPATNQLPPGVKCPTQSDLSSLVLPPPVQNPYSVVGTQRTPARQAAKGHAGQQSLGMTPLDAKNTPLTDNQRSVQQDGWTSSAGPSPACTRLVNSRTFDVEYDIESVGPWGVSKVELWGTHDGGQTWQTYGSDSDNRSPLRVTVPGSGVYGFCIVVHGAGGAPAEHPRTGDQAELKVAVDLQPPSLELLKAEIGQGDLAGFLSVEWTAADSNLEPRPIALFYSSQPSGPWSTIAAGLENTGRYTWRIERHVPARFYLRIVAHDRAGNQATYESPSSIVLPRPQPTGRLRSVRPVVQGTGTLRAASTNNQHATSDEIFSPPQPKQNLTK